MKKFALLNPDGTFNRQINDGGNIEWDFTHFCPAAALTPEERELFHVVELTLTPEPVYDRITQSCVRDGGECMDGQWRTKWLVSDLPPEQVAINQASAQAALIASYTAALDAHIDAVAQADRWDSRITCALRASYPNPWQVKGIAFGTWMDTCYALAYQIMADVQAQTRTLPTIDEFIAEMPVMEWPA